MKNKLDTFVNFPIHDLNMSKYVKLTSRGDQHPMYELYAVINHYGGLGGTLFCIRKGTCIFVSLLNYVYMFASFLNSAVTAASRRGQLVSF